MLVQSGWIKIVQYAGLYMPGLKGQLVQTSLQITVQILKNLSINSSYSS